MADTTPDRSDAADAARFRWILDGNGYAMEEEMLCGHRPCSEREKDQARFIIDEYMKEDSPKPPTTPPAPPEPQCPPVPDALLREWQEQTPRFRDGGVARERHLIRRGAQWGYAQALAAAQRLAAEERQRGVHSPEAQHFWADAELDACCEWLAARGLRDAALNALRAARRPPAPTLREQALAALRDKKHDQRFPGINEHHAVVSKRILALAIQALEEAGDE